MSHAACTIAHDENRWLIGFGRHSIEVGVEHDVYIWVASDRLVGTYGTRSDEQAAVEDLAHQLIEYYDDLAAHSDRMSDRLASDRSLLATFFPA